MTKQKAVQESAEHWERMIVWVDSKNDKDSPPFDEEMKKAIGEDWYDNYCSLCKKFRGCQKCPLQESYGVCTNDDNENAWKSVYSSATWQEWLVNAKKLLEQIKSLLK